MLKTLEAIPSSHSAGRNSVHKPEMKVRDLPRTTNKDGILSAAKAASCAHCVFSRGHGGPCGGLTVARTSREDMNSKDVTVSAGDGYVTGKKFDEWYVRYRAEHRAEPKALCVTDKQINV